MNHEQLKCIARVSWLCLVTGSISLGAYPTLANPPDTQPNFSIDSQSPNTDGIAQVNSVSQLSDVRSTDWAFQALQSVVERYGCIAGYPDSTYRGNRALTRYEFAAGLNACLDRINEQINSNIVDLVTKEDLETLQKLQEEFAAELATLRGRVDALEGRTATLEKQQFSTTTKLNGEAILSLAAATGGEPSSEDANVVFNNRVRLNLTSSFNGTDLLIVGLQAYNFRATDSLYSRGTIQGQLLPNSSLLGAGSTKLSFEPEFPGFSPQTLQADGGANSVSLYKLAYVLLGLSFTDKQPTK